MRYLIVLVVIALVSAPVISYIHLSTQLFGEARVCMKDMCFRVEVAETPEELSMGLMFRESIEPDRGMLFVFKHEGIHAFWMKNTLIPLDMIWISENNTVVFIKKNALPCESDSCPTIDPGKKAKYVLEVNGGISDQVGLEIGDVVTINNL